MLYALKKNPQFDKICIIEIEIGMIILPGYIEFDLNL